MKFPYQRTGHIVRNSLLVLFHRSLARHESKLHAQKLIKNQPFFRSTHMGHRLGLVNALKRSPTIDQIKRFRTLQAAAKKSCFINVDAK